MRLLILLFSVLLFSVSVKADEDSSGLPVVNEVVKLNTHYYLLKEKIGEGSFGHVFLAQEIASNRTVVVKIFLPEKESRFERIRRNYSVIQSLDGQNYFPKIYSIGTGTVGEREFLIVTMEPLDISIRKLSSRIYFRDDLVQVAPQILEQILLQMFVLNELGFKHNDIHTSNIMRTKDGRFVLNDFDLMARTSDGPTLSQLLAGNQGANLDDETFKGDLAALAVAVLSFLFPDDFRAALSTTDQVNKEVDMKFMNPIVRELFEKNKDLVDRESLPTYELLENFLTAFTNPQPNKRITEIFRIYGPPVAGEGIKRLTDILHKFGTPVLTCPDLFAL